MLDSNEISVGSAAVGLRLNGRTLAISNSAVSYIKQSAKTILGEVQYTSLGRRLAELCEFFFNAFQGLLSVSPNKRRLLFEDVEPKEGILKLQAS